MVGLPPTPDLVTVTTPGGAKFSVARAYAPRFQGFVNDLSKTYNIDPAHSGGYNPRMIAGTNIPSEHAYGRAIDVDWNVNPQGAGKSFTIPPDTARTLAKKYGLTWGGDWSGNTADPMHFQVDQSVNYDPNSGAITPNPNYVAPAQNTQVASVTPNPATANAQTTNAGTNVTPGSPTSSPNTNAPAVTPTSGDVAQAFQTHLAALQQQNANLQLQQNMLGQQNQQLAFGLMGSPTANFFSQAGKALSGIV